MYCSAVLPTSPALVSFPEAVAAVGIQETKYIIFPACPYTVLPYFTSLDVPRVIIAAVGIQDAGTVLYWCLGQANPVSARRMNYYCMTANYCITATFCTLLRSIHSIFTPRQPYLPPRPLPRLHPLVLVHVGLSSSMSPTAHRRPT